MNDSITMTAWEKMQLDMIYDDFDEDLFNRRVDAKNIFNKFNQTTDEQVEERKELLKQLFGSIGENVYVEPTFKCEFGKNTTSETMCTSTSALCSLIAHALQLATTF